MTKAHQGLRIAFSGLMLIFVLSVSVAHATQTDIPGPGGSGAFGTTVTVLPNGNIVVTDPQFGGNVGAVYLYNGATLALISTLTGSTGGDLVGNGGITVLTNGNFVVRSYLWNNGGAGANVAGAITWCSAATGCSGTVTTGNSLVGGRPGDAVGITGVRALTNGNYVVVSSQWNNPTGPANVGAVTWCNGATGLTVGLVTSANSTIGSTTGDLVGNGGATALSNGNYVVSSLSWDNPTGPVADVGAATWGNGLGGTFGAVTSGNSLIGGTGNDQVGSTGITALTNGNYVVATSTWDNPTGPAVDAGAATWGNGSGGTVGLVTSSNSIVGGSANDFVSSGGLTALTNGNYVVSSISWSNTSPATVDAGAATWGNGLGGTVGLVSSSNSLIGGSASDFVSFGGITALTNGNYVVASGGWGPSDVGAATWGNGSTGTVGLVSSSNSLIGGSSSDGVGNNGVTALSNGNYVVRSPSWDNTSPAIADVGAATWGNGTTGTVGLVSSANSLIGGTTSDRVSSFAVTALTNGNYVVSSPNWINMAGAATWGNGTTGTVGVVSSANSLVGGTAGDQVSFSNVTPLTNGNYLVTSLFWDNPTGAVDAGAVTWGNGLGGTVGPVTSSNSLVGGTMNDTVGSGVVRAFTNGNYAVRSDSWNNGGIVGAGAVTFGNGTSGTTGLITSANSVLGTAPSGVSDFSFDALRQRLVVGRGVSNTVSVLFFQTTAISNGNINNAATWDNGVPNALTNVIIPAPRTVTVNTASTIGSLNLATGATLVMSANLNVTGGLTLGTQIATGANTLGLSCSSSVSGAGASIFINGNVKRDFCATGSGFSYPTSFSTFTGGAASGAFSYPLGTTLNGNEYSPLNVNVTALGNNSPLETRVPSGLLAKATYGTVPPLSDSTTLDRFWTLTESGNVTANLVFNYLQTDVDGNESVYRIIRVSGGIAASFPNACPAAPCVDTTANTGTINGVSSFSDWTLGEGGPTAENATISGRIVTPDGSALSGTVVRLSGFASRTTISDGAGNYRFENLETHNFYSITPSLANYSFSPASRSFSLNGNITDAGFTGNPDAIQSTNAIDMTEYFVRQQYLDFLGREPDQGGLEYWSSQFNECNGEVNCIRNKRIDVSAAFFASLEFQQTGSYVYGLYAGTLGRTLNYGEFSADRAQVLGGGDLERAKQAFAEAFVQRSEFTTRYPQGMTREEFVDAVLQTMQERSGIDPSSLRDGLLNDYDTGGRALVARRASEAGAFVAAEYNKAFVMMQYYGYMRRDLDQGGYAFWLDVLNRNGGNYRGMVCSFLTSTEYQRRFGEVVTHSNAECGQQ